MIGSRTIRTARRYFLPSVFALCPIAAMLSCPQPDSAQPSLASSSTAVQEHYLTPIEARFSPDGATLYVVCEDDDSLLTIDVRSQRVTGRAEVGHKPKDVSISPDGSTLYVSNEWSDTVTVLNAATLKPLRTIPAGWGPIGLTTDRSGKFLYVANSISNDISIIDLRTGIQRKRLASWRSPHQVALSRDGRFVYVANILGHLGRADQSPVSELVVVDTRTQSVAERIEIPGVLELRHIAESPSAQGGYLLVPFMRPKNLNPLIQVADGWILTHGMAVIRPVVASQPKQGFPEAMQVLLDDIDYYYAGTNGVAITPDGRHALVTSSEADVVSLIDTAKLQTRLRAIPATQLGNRLDSSREFVQRRLPTGSNPTAVVISPNGLSAYVVNRLDDSLTIVDIPHSRVSGKIVLAGPKQSSQLRHGEQLFHSARFCFQGQFACFTCHPDNHIDGVAWNLETPQLGRDRVANRTLRGIAETAPYKWNGHNPDLETQCGPRIAKFLFHSEGFSKEQLADLVAFIKSIPLPPNRHLAANGELSPSQERGKAVFYKKSCDTCHPAATHYTAKTSFDVGTADKYDTSGIIDIPQLDRIYQRPPYLHSAQALSLEEIWTIYNPSDKHGVTSDMSKEELNDLIEFLKSL